MLANDSAKESYNPSFELTMPWSKDLFCGERVILHVVQEYMAVSEIRPKMTICRCVFPF